MSFWDTVLSPNTDADPVPPAQASKASLPEWIDHLAKQDPGRVCFSIPQSVELPEGFQDVSFATFADAVNRTAYFIQREIGRGSVLESAVLYIGENDLRCVIVFVALMKTGHKVIFSPSDHPASLHIDLIRKHGCTILLYTADIRISEILHHCRVETVRLPDDPALLEGTPCAPYRYTPSPSPGLDTALRIRRFSRPSLILAESGASGTRSVSGSRPSTPSIAQLPPGSLHTPSADASSPMRVLVSHSHKLPTNEAISSILRQVCYNNITAVLSRPGACTVEMFVEKLERGRIEAVECDVEVLKEIVERGDEVVMNRLRGLRYVVCVGGELDEDLRKKLEGYVHVHSIV